MNCYVSSEVPYFVFEVDIWSKVRQYEEGMVALHRYFQYVTLFTSITVQARKMQIAIIIKVEDTSPFLWDHSYPVFSKFW